MTTYLETYLATKTELEKLRTADPEKAELCEQIATLQRVIKELEKQVAEYKDAIKAAVKAAPTNIENLREILGLDIMEKTKEFRPRLYDIKKRLDGRDGSLDKYASSTNDISSATLETTIEPGVSYTATVEESLVTDPVDLEDVKARCD